MRGKVSCHCCLLQLPTYLCIPLCVRSVSHSDYVSVPTHVWSLCMQECPLSLLVSACLSAYVPTNKVCPICLQYLLALSLSFRALGIFFTWLVCKTSQLLNLTYRKILIKMIVCSIIIALRRLLQKKSTTSNLYKLNCEPPFQNKKKRKKSTNVFSSIFWIV